MLWQRAADASDVVAHLMTCIYAETVTGRETRAELTDAAALLERAVHILRKTEGRERPRYDEPRAEAMRPASWKPSSVE